jgi:flavin-dependent dehydrogenase
MELRARLTLFGEGCRGNLSEALMKKFNLRDGKPPQTYGLGLKEVSRGDSRQFFSLDFIQNWHWLLLPRLLSPLIASGVGDS